MFLRPGGLFRHMSRKQVRFFSLALLVICILLLLSLDGSLTGYVTGTRAIGSDWRSITGISSVLLSVILFVAGGSLESRLGQSSKEIREAAKSHHWIAYAVSSDSVPIDRLPDMGYLNDPQIHVRAVKTASQERIEKLVNRGRPIVPYVWKDTKDARNKAKGEAVNKRDTYHDQFYEPHAAGGGRVIDAETHIKEGKLFHFDMLVGSAEDGGPKEYIWVIDEDGHFVLGDRLTMLHDMYQMPPNLGSGERHEKVDKRSVTLPHATLARGKSVYGSGEVTIKDGLILAYNADSGHYVKLKSDLGGPKEPDNFIRQSVEAFRLVAKRIGWKEFDGGARFKSRY
jgi:hypothetical protein